jgi:hypothetical protein
MESPAKRVKDAAILKIAKSLDLKPSEIVILNTSG